MGEDAAPLALAVRLATQARLPAPVSAERLAGGKNNRVFRVTGEDGVERILKLYHRSPADPRDRLGAEWRFLSYACARGVSCVPVPLARDADAGAALYSALPGAKLAPSAIAARHVGAARDFIVALNRPPRDAGGLPEGSEACFSIADHLATVERRIARLDALDPVTPLRAAAEAFVRDALRPAWNRVRSEAHAGARALGEPAQALAPDERIVSPSDFGFHNALVAGDAVGFLDFEYAGLDDPAKLACDFFCAPEIPTPPDLFGGFVAGLAAGLPLGPAFPARAALLLPAYRIKWACIVLNEFLPVGAARRGFALDDTRAARCDAQLRKAAAVIDLIERA